MPSDEKLTRTEHDSLGDYEVPADAYFGIDTARAVANFPISDRRLQRAFIRASTATI